LERTVADTRIHGTTHKQVHKQLSRSSVLRRSKRCPPSDPFFHEAERSVNRDGHVEVAKAYYSTPPEYLGRRVRVRWDSRVVRIFNHRLEQIAIHVRHEPGRFSTQPVHIAAETISGMERGAAWLLAKIEPIRAPFQPLGQDHARSPRNRGDPLCCRAVEPGQPAFDRRSGAGLRDGLLLRRLAVADAAVIAGASGPKQETLPFLDEHTIIRPLTDYGQLCERPSNSQCPPPTPRWIF